MRSHVIIGRIVDIVLILESHALKNGMLGLTVM